MTENTISFKEPLPRFADGGGGAWGSEFALIQVPDVSRYRPRPIRAEAWSTDGTARRPALVIPRPRSRPRRRRLRREIRMTAYACLATLPLVIAAGVWSVHSTAPRAGAAEIIQTVRRGGEFEAGPPVRPLVWLSIEPVETGVDAEPEPAVIFPGYLLPPDHREEPQP